VRKSWLRTSKLLETYGARQRHSRRADVQAIWIINKNHRSSSLELLTPQFQILHEDSEKDLVTRASTHEAQGSVETSTLSRGAATWCIVCSKSCHAFFSDKNCLHSLILTFHGETGPRPLLVVDR
jgi:hypothetical protein